MTRVCASVLLALVCATTGGCQILRLNPGRQQAIALAAQVGEFRRTHGRWPMATRDLDQSTFLTEFDDADLGDAARHRIELFPRGANLRLDLYDAANRRVCRLEILAPAADSARALMPVVVVKTSVFSCPGEGKGFQ